MEPDSDYIIPDGGSPKDNYLDMLVDAIQNIPYKWLGYMFVIFMIVSSDMFIIRVLSKFSGAVDLKTPTNWGTVMQGLFLVLAMLVITGLIQQNVI